MRKSSLRLRVFASARVSVVSALVFLLLGALSFTQSAARNSSLADSQTSVTASQSPSPMPQSSVTTSQTSPSPSPPSSLRRFEYLWYEAENMRGFALNERNEPVIYQSWQNLPRGRTTGWAMNGPGVSAEWTQGGESEWNSAAAALCGLGEPHGEFYSARDAGRARSFPPRVRRARHCGRARRNEHVLGMGFHVGQRDSARIERGRGASLD